MSSWSLFYAAPSDAFAVTAAVYGNGQAAANGGYATSGYSSGVNTIHRNLDRYNSCTEKLAKRAGGVRPSEAYSYILTKVKKDIGVVGVNLAGGETDRQLLFKEKEPNYTVDEAANRIFHFAGQNTIAADQF